LGCICPNNSIKIKQKNHAIYDERKNMLWKLLFIRLPEHQKRLRMKKPVLNGFLPDF